MNAHIPTLDPRPSTLNPRIVIKVGGSLLDLPDLNERLVRLIQQCPGIRPVLIAGGGAAADVIRGWGRTFSLSEAVCHNLAMQSMSLTASLLTRIVPHIRMVRSRAEVELCWTDGERPVLDVLAWWQESPVHRAGLPNTWAVTSDSLSAAVADHWHADELWLLKSADLPPEISLLEASRQGLVDDFFPQLASRLQSISWCNLRAVTPHVRHWDLTRSYQID